MDMGSHFVRLCGDHRRGLLVVVLSGHTNTVPDIIEEFGADPVPAIAENEYDNLYVVTVYRFNRAKVLHLNYGDPD